MTTKVKLIVAAATVLTVVASAVVYTKFFKNEEKPADAEIPEEKK